MQKGSVLPFLVLITLLALSLGLFFVYQRLTKTDIPVSPQSASNEQEETTYREANLRFEFKYSKELIAKIDTEEEFNKRGNGDFRKNFKGYVGYEPGKFLGAVVVLEKEKDYDTNPFTLWLFDNPDELSINKWHHDYWYYPFVWGDFTSEGKFTRAPQEEATVSGQTGKFGIIEYQPGKPKFIYISREGKMYLFRVIGGEGEKILSTFKLL